MQSTSIMQEIRVLLEQGKRSGELIKMGFAPGTVYKVQRQVRRRTLTLGADLRRREPGLMPSGEVPVTASWARAGRLEAENANLEAALVQRAAEVEALHAEVENTKVMIGEFQKQVQTLQGQLSAYQAARDDMEHALLKVRATLDESERVLRAVEGENSELKAYLRSRNCGWEGDFLRHTEPCRSPCSLQLPCTGNSLSKKHLSVKA